VLLNVFFPISPYQSQKISIPPLTLSGIARNSQWERRVMAGVWRQSPQPPEAIGVWGQSLQLPDAWGKAPSQVWKQGGLGAKSPALGNFCSFSIKIMHFYA